MAGLPPATAPATAPTIILTPASLPPNRVLTPTPARPPKINPIVAQLIPKITRQI